MTYKEYIAYHKRGDASIEERLVLVITRELGLNEWETFKFIYLYATLYDIPTPLKMPKGLKKYW